MTVPTRSEQQWAGKARMDILRGNTAKAESSLTQALEEFPHSFELRLMCAGVHQQAGRLELAESLLRELLIEQPGDTGAAFTLARIFIERGRSQAAAVLMRDWFDRNSYDIESAIQAIELLDDEDCKAEAAAIAEQAIAATPQDARLHAYAGMLELQLGEFERAREHYLFALANDPRACEWQAPQGLAAAQCYKDRHHPDFALLESHLQRNGLSVKARASLLFALGKAHDDIGDHERAAACFREANPLARALTNWSCKSWRRGVEAQLAASALPSSSIVYEDFMPIFIVGMPRSGTTLLAELLARAPQVCNRGESPWLPKLVLRPEISLRADRLAINRATQLYATHLRKDNAPDSHWFIDKQPLNFRYLDLVFALFPATRVLYCRRSPRDTALSLWMQSFVEDEQGYAYDFSDMEVVIRDCERLMAHWQTRYSDSIRIVQYEEVIADPSKAVSALREWLGLPDSSNAPVVRSSNSIGTASLWQARQPVFTHSIARWRNYVAAVPELLRFAE